MADEEMEVKQEDAIKEAASLPDDQDASNQEGSDEGQGAGDEGDIPPEIGIEALKRQIENERRGRLEAEQRANAAMQKVARSEHDVQDSNLQLVVSAIETVKRENMVNRRAYAEAMAAGDFEKAAEIQDVMGLNNAKLLQLENGRDALQERVKNPPRPQPPADPVERIASQLSPRSADWIRAHPDCVRDQKKYMKMIGCHNIAVADGLTPDSDEYFEYIETQLGLRKSAPAPRQQAEEMGDDPSAQAAKPMARKPQPPAAPPSRGAGGNGNRMTLTSAQREAAEIAGISYEEYARNMNAEKKRRSN
jgi:hypothetical protein